MDFFLDIITVVFTYLLFSVAFDLVNSFLPLKKCYSLCFFNITLSCFCVTGCFLLDFLLPSTPSLYILCVFSNSLLSLGPFPSCIWADFLGDFI